VSLTADSRPTAIGRRPAVPAARPRLGVFGARRDGHLRRIATGVTVLTALIAVMAVAAAAVVFTIG
jgi:hypothetical protein